MSPEGASKIIPLDIKQEMKTSFVTYAMSVNLSRSLPDVRDGLKPVHRRILYAMFEAGNTAERPYRKAAKTVGEVLGNFHPHGDTAVYDALARLAQDWNIRYPLIDGQGNFGSVDGDPPAAMRYTEARLSRLAAELLTDIEKNTVDFSPNFDNSDEEPTVLPSRFPNLLVNGSMGIGVAMATNIPPHNLGEVIDAIVLMIERREEGGDVSIEDLMEKVKGPDFPTGGLILGREGIKKAYHTGRGSVTMRAKAHIETMQNGRNRIMVTEIPYTVNKAKLIERIAELVNEKRVEGISDIRDESDRTGMRIVVELKRDGNANVVLNQLYKYTALQQSFGINMLALVDGRPVTLNLKDALHHYVLHQKEVIVRRSKFDLEKAEARAHIVEGLLRALDAIDEVIETIRSSPDTETARNRLMERFAFSAVQAQHILDMQLRRLTGLEREKLQQEYQDLQEQIDFLRALLASDKRQYEVIKHEILEIRRRFADARRTRITADEAGQFDVEDLIAEEDIVITMTHLGYIKRVTTNTYRSQRRGGRGITGQGTRDEDFLEHVFTTTTHHDIMFFTNKGKCYRLKAHEIPEGSRTARGTAVVNLIALTPGERVYTVFPVRNADQSSYLFFATKNGQVKKTLITEYANVRSVGLIAIALEDGDELVNVCLTNGSNDIILVSTKGYAIRFEETDVRPMGRDTRGVRGISLDEGAHVVGMDVVQPDADLLVVTTKGYGKRTPMVDYPVYGRGAHGVKTINLTEKNGDLVAIRTVREQSDLICISSNGVLIRMPVKPIRQTGRSAQGVLVMNLDEGDQVVAVAVAAAKEEDEPI